MNKNPSLYRKKSNGIERMTQTSFHSKPLTSKPGSECSKRRPLLSESSFHRTLPNFAIRSLHSNKQNHEFDSKPELVYQPGTQNQLIKMNMENHFLILDNLFKNGGLENCQNFKFSREEAQNSDILQNTEVKCDVFKIMNNCNIKALERIPKVSENQKAFLIRKLGTEKECSQMGRTTLKNVREMKKNFFYFQKEKIMKCEHRTLRKNVVISEIYKKYFERKTMNKLCNLKEFSDYLIKKDDSQIFKEIKDKALENQLQKKEKARNLPRLNIARMRSQRNSFL